MEAIVIKNHQVISNNLPKEFKFENKKLTIPSKTIYHEPIKITLLEDNHDELEIVIGESSEIKIILEVTDDTMTQSDYKIKLTAAKNAKVKYLLVAALKSTKATLNHEFIALEDTNLELLAGLVSNVLTAKLDVAVAGKGASVNIKAIAVSSDEHDQNIDVYMKHQAPNTFGDMTNIGIANKKGRVILNGVEKIEKGMKNSNVYQTLKGIITSNEAVIEVNPILLIDEYDIKAGHAATVGKLEEESLYYLMSRGLSKIDAEKLIINGFLQPVINEIDDEELKERFVELVNSRI
ncbi:SUF system FeS cluster assembly protein [Alteracholeplasma palmae J233]|uniref:SUF system FeS cluster assembly protein n=1 Tax=Alteracholeplasma palmae (strain ATCC 49389 / J233) TaxID=1318466 RepID=U4KJZ3_ALTPJ|nr:SufD family Fe-S cluster assembly protein [Alteracholeplasma palmae]CCV63803.1 SUF system FeS cluster assembly protein [Alteracholeplasma palmae J233]